MGFLKSIFGAPPKGPSAAELQARKEQQQQLEMARLKAEREAGQARKSRIANQRARRSGTLGRRSLINNGELGEGGKLG